MRCGCCHGIEAVPLLRAPDRDGQPVRIFHCRECCALTPEYPGDDRCMVERQIAFHEIYWCADTKIEYLRDRDSMRRVLQFHEQHLHRNRDQVVYDLGAGRGNLLACLLENGHKAAGCEPSVELSDRARAIYGLEEHQLVTADISRFLASRPGDKGRVAAIFLWHVLEHLSDAVDTLRLCADFLSETGVIIAQGPLLAPEYVYREHNFLHSESNIKWLADRSGLKVLLCEAQDPSRFVSFVLGRTQHPAPVTEMVFLSDPLAAAGSLYFTQSRALNRLLARMAVA